MKFQNLLLLVFINYIFITSCGKYQDGPTLSLTSKENRLCQTWKLERIDHSNGYSTDEFYFKLNFVKNKSLQIEHNNISGQVIQTTSSWDWLLGSYGLTLNLGNHPQGLPSGSRNFEIKRLTKKELWIQDRGSLIMYKLKSE